VSLSSILAACGGGDDGGGSGSGSKEVTFGSNQSDEVPKKAYAEMTSTFQKSSGLTVKTNTVEHETFQENINNYLQGNPDDVFTWFAGYRMRFFASQGLTGDISDVYGGLTGFSEAFKQASTGDDGKQYFVPLTTYPWALFYRKSVWEEKGYQPPRPWTSWSPWPSRWRATGWYRSPSPTRTAGRRWARSTSSTCASTATSSTST
jgi:multiple sugar transport system substrate-binding protein